MAEPRRSPARRKALRMKTSRIIVLFLAVAAAGGAFWMANGSKAPPPEPVAALPAPPPPVATDDVLVSAHDIPIGTKLADQDLAWQSWPKDGVPAGALRKSESPNLKDELKGSIARVALLAGEPVRREKLIKGENGFLSAILPSGKRAVAISIENSGANTAGGFILPNDRVDVVRTVRQPTKPGAPQSNGDNFISQTLLTNIKVLAIGQNIQDKNGQPVVQGTNATLELDPDEAETIILAQRTGQLSLTLRSLQDAHQAEGAAAVRQASHSLSVVRYGNVTEDGAQ